jgi:hypothetical protein
MFALFITLSACIPEVFDLLVVLWDRKVTYLLIILKY